MVLKRLSPLILLYILTVFTACTGNPVPLPGGLNKASAEPLVSSFFTSAPERNGLVFIGAVGRRSSPKETVQLALEDAARQVAIFYEVSGEYAVQNNVGSGAFDYTYDTYTNLYYNKEGSSQYVDALKYDADTDAVEIENVFFIRTTYQSALPFPIGYRPQYSGADKKPDWVDDPPFEIEGYEVGVGYAGRHSSMSDTYTNSRNNAVFAIIRKINSVSQSSNLLYQNTGSLFGYKTSDDNIIYSYGTLNGFYVLDTWIDQNTKAVWTLAIARKSQ